MAINWKALARNKRVWAVAGIGGAAGLGVAVARRKKATSPADMPVDQLTGGPYVPNAPGVFDSSLQDLYEGFNATAADLQQQVNDISDQLGQRTPTSPSTPPPTATTPKRQYSLHKIGVQGRTYNLRDIARRFAPTPSNPNSVEAELRALVKANPKLRGKSTIPGGFPLRVIVR